VYSKDLKIDFRIACKLALKDGLNLKLIYKDLDTSVFIKGGVRKGVIIRFFGDV
ncbi:hypothetical protein LZ31DRAFT_423827, partial [Colletotrichum somersetense]